MMIMFRISPATISSNNFLTKMSISSTDFLIFCASYSKLLSRKCIELKKISVCMCTFHTFSNLKILCKPTLVLEDSLKKLIDNYCFASLYMSEWNFLFFLLHTQKNKLSSIWWLNCPHLFLYIGSKQIWHAWFRVLHL